MRAVKRATRPLRRGFKINIRSRHGTHKPLRTQLPRMPFRTIVRLGSETVLNDGKHRYQCNTPQAVRNSANKLLMKQRFQEKGVSTCDWIQGVTGEPITIWATGKYPIVGKEIHGSRNRGNTLIKSPDELTAYLRGKNLANYIFEKYFNGVREYRLHVTKMGCFYTCRKMLKEGTPDNQKWYRNDSNCVWIKEDNNQFNKPEAWNSIVAESIKALSAVGLDIGAVDVKVKANGTDFKIIEINSAPSFGDITLEKYLVEIPKVLRYKYAEGETTTR